MPLDSSVDKVRVRGRAQFSTGLASPPPSFFSTVERILNKVSHSRIAMQPVQPYDNQTSSPDPTAPAMWNPTTGDWWADLIAVDDADLLASGQTQWGQWGCDDRGQRYFIEPKLVSPTFYGAPLTGAPLAQGSGGIRTVWLDDLAQLFSPVLTPGVGGSGGGLDAEGAQDAVAAMFAAGTHSGIGFVYDDAGNRISATVTVTGDLPESTAGLRTTAAGTPTDLLGVINEYTGVVSQTLPPALPGRVLAFRQRTVGLTLARAGSDVFVLGDGTQVNSVSPAVTGELVQYHCSVAGQWRANSDFKPTSALVAMFGAILNTHLLAWTYAQAFRLVSATRDANSAITTASVVWPDGSTGTFTTTTASSAFPGAIDAYTVTYVPASGASKTVTQPAVTRDSAGAVTAQPALTVA
ncbi:hypothetical protein GCM10023201_40800 [Actinomycetospora corticicola]|uniref:Uncharacterized protein n=1 Tax=Actinomycetospora corticicola TaxID=663602 RepID=A0A7Y9DWQ5_9PSEU|nr:hypothetical protein [Actinomycetospora corticicola]NYD36836.1 hypothetical protein [Actinomycetospora corticicola]